ncbi:MAG TPA: hypothetical protein VIL99_16200 [Ignavibacteria bacterium]
MHYKIVSGKTREQLERSVNELITKGYEPIGGMVIESVSVNSAIGKGLRFNMYQSMLGRKYDDKGAEKRPPKPIKV